MAETIASAKRALRKHVLAVRDALPESVRVAKSAAICCELAALLPHATCAAASHDTAAVFLSRDSAEPDEFSSSPICSESATASCDTQAALAPRDSRELDGFRFSPDCNESAMATDNSSEASRARSAQPPTVALYAPMGSEVDVAPLAELARERGCRVALPCMLTPEDAAATGQRMCIRAVDAKHLATAPFATHPLEPLALDDARANAQWPVVEPSGIDLTVVPLVAFDARGARLGYGGGCYDRYLPLLKSDCIIVGAAFEEQHVDAVPCDEHDALLERIVCA